MKKLFFVALAVALFVCALAISVSATPQNYGSFEVVLNDDSRITVYTAGTPDQGNGHLRLSEVAYTEAPVDTDGTYAVLDWSTVKEIDFTVTSLNYYNSKTGEYDSKVGGTNNNSKGRVCVIKDWSDASVFDSVKRVNTGNSWSFGANLFNGWCGLETVEISSSVDTLSDNMFMNSSVANVLFSENSKVYRCNNNLFRNCDNIVSITLPDSFTYLGNSGLFCDCDNLESVVWSKNCPAIPGSAFDSCEKLKFEIPSYITEIKSSAFSNCKSITSVVIPSGVTAIGSDCFRSCSNLTSIVFEEGCSVTEIYAHVFDGCAFSEITLPNTVVQIRQNAFAGNKNLKVVNLGAAFRDFNLLDNKVASLNSGSALEELYLSENFVASYVRSDIFGDDNNSGQWPKIFPNLVIFYSGDKSAADAIVAAAQGTDGVVVNGVLAEITVVSLEEYEALKAAEALSGRYLVYGYNKCDAFYKGEHAAGAILNSCEYGCARDCGQSSIREDAEHNLVVNTLFGENGYFGASTACEQCTVCATKTREGSFEALFVSKGVSAKTFGDDIGLVQGYELNRVAINGYRTYVSDFDFGVLAYANVNGGAVQPKPGDDKVVDIVFDNMANDYIEVKITGIPTNFYETPIVFCVYVTEGGKLYYLDNGVVSETVIGNSYNNIVD